jgi:hypothetical protein
MTNGSTGDGTGGDTGAGGGSPMPPAFVAGW